MVQGPGRALQYDAGTPAILAQLHDFEYLARDLGSYPTSLSEIVPGMPAAPGASDAAKSGMGGVWFLATTNSNLWPHPVAALPVSGRRPGCISFHMQPTWSHH
jgi:hypothetical protein